ncbi:hypothetical protein [Bacillus cereus]|nr:hypothetical protein [Bacillus cereus]
MIVDGSDIDCLKYDLERKVKGMHRNQGDVLYDKLKSKTNH